MVLPSMNSWPSWLTPMIDATDTRLTFDTAATRSPAPITGTAIGNCDREQPLRLV